MSEKQSKRGRRAGADSPSSGAPSTPGRQHQAGPAGGTRPASNQLDSSQSPSTSHLPSTSQSAVSTLTPPAAQAVRGRGCYRKAPWEQELKTIPAGITSTVATDAKPLRFLTNYVKIKCDDKASKSLRLYRVDFEPIVDNDDMRYRLVRKYAEPLFKGNYTYDRGNDLQSHIVLPNEVTTVQAKHPADGTDIMIKIKNTGSNTSDFNYIRNCNLQMNEFLRKMGYFKMRESYYHMAFETKLDNFGLSIIGGFNTTTCMLSGGIMMNLESRNKILQNMSMLQMIAGMRRQFANDNMNERIRQAMTGKVVITKYNNRTYKIEDIDFSMTPASTFPRRDGTGEQSFSDYYLNIYNLRVTNMTQPLFRAKVENVERRRRQAEMAGDTGETPIRLVPEFCYLTDLSDEQKNNTQIKMARIQASQVAPTDKVKTCREFLNKLHTTPYVVARCQAWKYSYERDLVEISGRQLDQVDVITGNPDRRRRTKCQNANFDQALRNTPIYEVPSLPLMTLILGRSRQDPPNMYSTLLGALSTSMDSVGLVLRGPHINKVELSDTSIRSYLTACRELPAETTIVLCLLPDQAKDRYDAIKRHLSIERGIPSQCFLAKHFRMGPGPRLASTCSKIAIQVACKIGGVPWSLEMPPIGKYMICGYDAWHDSVTARRSWGAFCSSLNSNFTKWWSKANHHNQLEELSTNLANNVFQGVLKYREYNKTLPEKIIIYRDGVGQGDFEHIYTIEIKQIKEKLERLEKETKKKIHLAIVVVTKRIGARFFLKKQQPNQFDNAPPGTVIDSDITRQSQYDFYLVSHHTRNGTISPTMYNIIQDNTGLKPAQMQTLAYKLCHLYFNWSGAVRVPAPCQYAHKLAYLMGESLHNLPHSGLDNYLHYL